jgi:hypothetical protein
MDTKTARIRALNDELRQNFAGGIAVMTPGIAALGAEAVARIVKTVAVFDDFCHANDPHEEHDFGAFDADVREGIVARRRRKPRPSATSREEPQPKLPPIELSMNEFYGPPR